ncbi:MAG: hypothetical protein P1Q69_21340, partial [Candidatus Thorarchaeota archaeon]|nr:hypothetical protein [Candidatus Thorarchaeota archaeon]
MTCEERIQQELMRILNEPVSIAGVPLIVVERKLREFITESILDCDEHQIQSVIQKNLDDWVIDKTV